MAESEASENERILAKLESFAKYHPKKGLAYAYLDILKENANTFIEKAGSCGYDGMFYHYEGMDSSVHMLTGLEWGENQGEILHLMVKYEDAVVAKAIEALKEKCGCK